MQQLIINITKPAKHRFLLELLKSLDFVEVVGVRKFSKEQLEFARSIQQGLSEVEQHRRGEIKLQTAREFLDSL